MKHRSFIIFSILMLINKALIAQQQSLPGYQLFRIVTSHSAFPDTARTHGHIYDSLLYDADTHYHDSSVLIIVPSKLQASKKLNMVFWFHGWRNNIDTAVNYYHLAEQFIASDRSAVLVLAETAKNAPDSYGGKLEQPKVFAGLVEDVILELKRKKLVSGKCQVNHVILAGHSGAYRVIAYILENGAVAIQEVQLFDALYGETDKFNNWVQQNASNRLINWYTNQGGGTDEVSIQLMDQFKKEGIPLLSIEETKISPPLLHATRVVFVHSTRAHNDIIFNPDNFLLLLENSPFLEKLR